jgi:hypothetical protein
MPHKPDRLDLVTPANINRELGRRLVAEAARMIHCLDVVTPAEQRLLSEAARIFGGSTSARKAAASRINGHLGGRPRKYAPCLYNANGYHTFAYRDPVTGVIGRCPCGLTIAGEWKTYGHDREVNKYRAECWQRERIGAKWRNLEAKSEEEK